MAQIVQKEMLDNPPAFAAGTRLGFNHTSAPTGWTKDTTAELNDSIMRIVTGSVSSGGSNAFSTVNAQTSVGATTLSTTEMPSHNHNRTTYSKTVGGGGMLTFRARQTATARSGVRRWDLPTPAVVAPTPTRSRWASNTTTSSSRVKTNG